MKILFTGGSSFTGLWFVKELSQAGHEVVCPLRQTEDRYSGLRKKRIDQLLLFSRVVFDCPFNAPSFFKLIEEESWDLFCQHAADVTDYKSPDFQVVPALANNTGEIKQLLQALQKKGCNQIVLTGSIFEQNEGAGSDGLRAVSPYGLSKGLTADMFKFYTQILQMGLAKFVIPNPFGPYEEFRFTSFLIQNWFARKVVPVTQPAYVRDNIPVSLLAKAYKFFAENSTGLSQFSKLNPSGYPESQGAFTARFAQEMRIRLNLPCAYELSVQKEFPEPKVRINTDLLDADDLEWNETSAWDELADYYSSTYSLA